jgi:hypothetical protein
MVSSKAARRRALAHGRSTAQLRRLRRGWVKALCGQNAEYEKDRDDESLRNEERGLGSLRGQRVQKRQFLERLHDTYK